MSRLIQHWRPISIALVVATAITVAILAVAQLTTSPLEKAKVRLVNGPVSIVDGQHRRTAKAGDLISPMTPSGGERIETPSGSAVLVSLPDGSTVELGGSSAMWYSSAQQANQPMPLTLHGSGTFVVPAGVRLIIYSGASVTTVHGPARFTETLTGNHGDAFLQVTKGSVTATSTEGLGAVTGHAGEGVVLKGPRGA